MLRDAIPGALAGERLDRVVSLLSGASRAVAHLWVSQGRVSVNDDVVITGKARVEIDDDVTVDVPDDDNEPALEPDPDVSFGVVYEDADVIVVDKPPGLVVHPGSGQQHKTLVHGLLARFPDLAGIGGDPIRPGVVHRIDRDTSGLLVVARSQEAFESVVAQLQARSVERLYRVLVWGALDAPAGMIEAPIGRSRRDPTKMAVIETGRQASTRYSVERSFTEPVEASLIECRLLTGRTHQIRVHLKSIGHAVVGDRTYGGTRQSFEVPRLFLHAAVLGFDHPVTGERVRFESRLPDDLARALDRLS